MLGTALTSKNPYCGTSVVEGKRFVFDILTRLKPDTGLDIGCGSGTYARLFPELEWTGVEIWEPYVTRFSLNRLYERFILADVRTWKPDAHYDLAMAGDILEYMTEEEAISVMNKLKACASTVVLSIPVVPYDQPEVVGNLYEKRIVNDWCVDKVIDRFGAPAWRGVESPIGVFVWGKY